MYDRAHFLRNTVSNWRLQCDDCRTWMMSVATPCRGCRAAKLCPSCVYVHQKRNYCRNCYEDFLWEQSEQDAHRKTQIPNLLQKEENVRATLETEAFSFPLAHLAGEPFDKIFQYGRLHKLFSETFGMPAEILSLQERFDFFKSALMKHRDGVVIFDIDGTLWLTGATVSQSGVTKTQKMVFTEHRVICYPKDICSKYDPNTLSSCSNVFMNAALIYAMKEVYAEFRGEIQYIFVSRGNIYSAEVIHQIFPEIPLKKILFICDRTRDDRTETRIAGVKKFLEDIEFNQNFQRFNTQTPLTGADELDYEGVLEKLQNRPVLIVDDRFDNSSMTEAQLREVLSANIRFLHPHSTYDPEVRPPSVCFHPNWNSFFRR